ncbi:MAG: hypothetical protein RIB84_20450 [Sneathiellaceae bacterium]
MVDLSSPAGPAGATVAAATTTADTNRSHVDWPAILAGTAVATAVSFVLNTFGTAVGLSAVSPFDRDGISMGLLIAVALWLIWVTVSSFMLGAYVCGRLRRRAFDATEHESDVRDGMHGVTVWALGILVGALILAAGVNSAVKAGAEALSGAAQGAGTAIEGAASQIESSDFQLALNKLLRPVSEGSMQTGLGDPERQSGLRNEFGLIVETAPGDEGLPTEDKDYMATVLSSELGIDREQADARIAALENSWQTMRQEAKEAAETARQASILGAFVIAAALLIAAAGAWWAAGMGGRHRDEQTVFRLLARRT